MLAPPVDLKLEVAVDSLESAFTAAQAGADRLELCAGLFEGGTTPSAGFLAVARAHLDLDLFVIVRPRGGDFVYSAEEIRLMRHDIQVAKQMGANGIVAGVLTADGQVDTARTAELVAEAAPLPFTFHRAFDWVVDPLAELESLIALGCHRVLSSGQQRTAYEGRPLLKQMVELAAGRLIVMPGGGVNERLVGKLWRDTGATEFHLSARMQRPSAMRHHNPQALMGGGCVPMPEHTRFVADGQRIAEVKQILRDRGGV
ncbi:MAG: copper homeostasis protein CutC [Bernardetiaceae bacterium]|jgi:copper homeostasis protein|nr:copper homeostasis protein CutC [Bernardetiaceae bacterium]